MSSLAGILLSLAAFTTQRVHTVTHGRSSVADAARTPPSNTAPRDEVVSLALIDRLEFDALPAPEFESDTFAIHGRAATVSPEPASLDPPTAGTSTRGLAAAPLDLPLTLPPAAISGLNPLSRARAALRAGVPAVWRNAVPADVELSQDSVTASRPDGHIRVAHGHATGDWLRLVAIMTHEFGHLMAFTYGTHAELGSAPEGWPDTGSIPVEHWADCVARALTGVPLASHGQTACSGAALTWTEAWVASGPVAHQRTS